MKVSRILLIVISLCLVGALTLGCSSRQADTDEQQAQTVAVSIGDVTVDVTGIGNLLYSNMEDLTCNMAGTIEEVHIEVGDFVEEGQLLVTINTEQWENQSEALNNAVTAAENNLISAERNLDTAQSNVLQREISLLNAEKNLNNALDLPEWNQDEDDIAIKEMQLELAQMQLEEAQNSVIDIQKAIEDAQQSILNAQQELEELADTEPLIEAPYDGYITAIGVSPNNTVTEGRVAAVIADPDEFEAIVWVNEVDILYIQPGTPVEVTVDALSGLTLPATVTHINPFASIQSGVVNYAVTIELESLETQLRRPGLTEISDEETEGEVSETMFAAIDELLDEAIQEGLITREQADLVKTKLTQTFGEDISAEQVRQMIERFAQFAGAGKGDMTKDGRPLGELGKDLPKGIEATQLPGRMQPVSIRLMEGLTVTVSIIVQEQTDVLIVPNNAVTYRGLQASVSVMNDGIAEERIITTGISDWQYTEIITGLSEGELVVIPQSSSTSSNTDISQQPDAFRMFKGLGGK